MGLLVSLFKPQGNKQLALVGRLVSPQATLEATNPRPGCSKPTVPIPGQWSLQLSFTGTLFRIRRFRGCRTALLGSPERKRQRVVDMAAFVVDAGEDVGVIPDDCVSQDTM